MTLQALPIQTQIAHIKGHPDGFKQWADLDILWAKINVFANNKANAI
jgi:hypothetical protein